MVPELLLLKHFKYLDAASGFVDGLSNEAPEIMDPNKCDVAVWLKENPNSELEEVHTQFHRAIGSALDFKKQGRNEDANIKMDEAYILLAKLEKMLLEI